MEYKVDDKALSAAEFIPFVNQVWPGDYDMDRTQAALSRTLNITAYDGKQLVGCLRILSDGYFFGTITELLVLPSHQKQGIGSRLFSSPGPTRPPCCILSPTGREAFYEKNGCQRSLQSYMIEKR